MKFYAYTILCVCLFLVCNLYPMQRQVSPFTISQIPNYSPLRCFFPVKNYKRAAVMAYYFLLSASVVGLEIANLYGDPSVREAIMLDRTVNQAPVPVNQVIRMAFDYNTWFEDCSCYIKTHIPNRTNQ